MQMHSHGAVTAANCEIVAAVALVRSTLHAFCLFSATAPVSYLFLQLQATHT